MSFKNKMITKKEMTARCREILYGEPEVIGDNLTFMLDILNMHTEADSKIGCGVARMWSKQNPVYRHTRNFWVERHDGTTTDFSFTHCISPKDDFKSACRNAIRYQIKVFKDANGMDKTRHADHHPESFDSLLSRFVADNGKCKVIGTKDNSFGCFLEDSEYERRWQEFHQKEAVLRNVSATENLTKKRL